MRSKNRTASSAPRLVIGVWQSAVSAHSLFGTEAVFNPKEAMGMNTIPTEIVGGLPPPNIMAKFGQAPCAGCQLSRSEQLSGDAGSSGRPDSPNGGPWDRIASWILAVFSFAALAFALYVIWVKCAGLSPFYESAGSRSDRFKPHLVILESRVVGFRPMSSAALSGPLISNQPQPSLARYRHVRSVLSGSPIVPKRLRHANTWFLAYLAPQTNERKVFRIKGTKALS